MNRRGFLGTLFRTAAAVCAIAYSTPKLVEVLAVPRAAVSINPARVARNLLLEVIDPSEVDLPAFERWAEYCDAEGLEWEGMHAPENYHEVLCSLSESGRGVISCVVPGNDVRPDGEVVLAGTRFTVAKNGTHPFPPPLPAMIPFEAARP